MSFSWNTTAKMNVTIIALSIVMMIAVLNLPFKAKPFGDFDFHREAKNIALYFKGKVGYDQVIVSKAPGTIAYFTIPYLLAPADATDDELWYYAVFFNFFIGTISALLLYNAANSLFSKEVGLFSVLLMFVFPIHCYYAMSIIGETPAFFSFCLALFGWSQLKNGHSKKTGLLLLIFGISFLILNRPNTILILPIAFLFGTYYYFKKKEFFNAYSKTIIVAIVASGVIGFLGLGAAKKITAKKFHHNQEEVLNYVLFQGRFQFRNEPTDFRFWDRTQRADSQDYQDWRTKNTELSVLIEKKNKSNNEVYRNFVLKDYFQNPYISVRQFFVKVFYGQMYFINSVKPKDFKLGPFYGVSAYWSLILLINAINILILIGFLKFILMKKRSEEYWLFWSGILSLIIFHGLTYMEPRYMFPAKPAFFILGAIGLYQMTFFRKAIDRLAKAVY